MRRRTELFARDLLLDFELVAWFLGQQSERVTRYPWLVIFYLSQEERSMNLCVTGPWIFTGPASRHGSSNNRDGWPLASLSCRLLTALREPHAPCLFRLPGGLVTTNCSDRQVTALVTVSESTRGDMFQDMLPRSVLWQD